MKAKAIQFLCILCAVSLLSCEKENEAPDGFVNASFSAAFDESSQEFYSEDGSKTYRSGTSTLWSASDQIKVFYSNNTSSTFTLASGNGTKSAQFAGLAPAGKTANYAVYPAGDTALRSSDTIVNVTIPENQTGTFASCNYAVSCIHSGNELYFSNIAAMLGIETSDAVTTIVVESVGGNALRGTLPVTCSSGTVSVGAATSTGSSITVSTSGSGIKYIAILGGVTHAKGLKFTFKNSSGVTTGTYYLNKNFAPVKDKVYNFGDFEPTKEYYVTVSGAGKGNGLSWANAMSKDTMFGMLSRSAAGDDSAKKAALFDAINGATFYMAAGTYNFGETPTIDIDEASAITFKLEGGYNSSTGARSISGNKTYITGARAGDPSSYTGHRCLTLSGKMNVTLDGLYFINGYTTGQYDGALHCTGSSLNVEMTDCEVSNNLNSYGNTNGGNAGLCLYSANQLTATRVTFSGNQSIHAPALYTYQTDMTLNNCTFSDNTASSWGGAVRIRDGSPTCSFTSCTFSGNSATGDAGCVYANGGTTTFTTCTFTGNHCSGNGGALRCAGTSVVTISGGSFKGNYASGDDGNGGAICVDQNTPTLSVENCTFGGTLAGEPNYSGGDGGALSLKVGSTTITNCSFVGNYARNDDATRTEPDKGYGGAIDCYSSAGLNITGGTFSGNKAWIGGAINSSSTGTVSISGATFTGNGGSTTRHGGVARISRNVGFTNCTFGGASAALGNQALNGGVFYVEGGTTTISGGSFSHNVANTTDTNYGGGAIFMRGGATVNVSGASFNDNSTTSCGGAICGWPDGDDTNACTLSLSSNCVFSGNSASKFAGAIMFKTKGTMSVANSSFTDNYATQDSGAFNGDNSDTEYTFNTVEFSGNHGGEHGGAMWIEKGTYSFTGCTFSENYLTASNQMGGAVFMHGTTAPYEFTNCTFTGNYSSGGYGGAMAIDVAGEISIKGGTFDGNYSKTGGAILAKGNGSVTIAKNGSSRTLFTRNYTQTNGNYGGAIRIESKNADFSCNGADFTYNEMKMDSEGDAFGGAISITASQNGVHADITDCAFSNNTTTYGGATAISYQSATGAGNGDGSGYMRVSDCSFTNNATNYSGTNNTNYGRHAGAVRLGHDATPSYFYNCTFSGNHTQNVNKAYMSCYGGAITYYADGMCYLDNCYFENNYAPRGGAISALKCTESGMYLNACSFSGNYATYDRGSAIYVDKTKKFCMNNCSFNDNTYSKSYDNEGCTWIFIGGNTLDSDGNKLEECVVSNCSLIGTCRTASSTELTSQSRELLYAIGMASSKTMYLINNIVIANTSYHDGWWTNGIDVVSYNNIYQCCGRTDGSYTPTGNTGKYKASGGSYSGTSVTKSHLGNPSWNTSTHVWPWNGTIQNGGPSITKITASTFDTQMNNGSSAFKTWLQDINPIATTGGASAVNRLHKDALGTARGDGSTQWYPGAYKN